MNAASPETGAASPGKPAPSTARPAAGASEPVRNAHPRHRRVGALLRGACEDPDTLVAVLGHERIADLLGLPESAISSLNGARPALRRRFALHLRRRIGLTRLQVVAARELPDDLRELVYGIYLFATTLRLADTPRILPRARMRALAASYGEEPLSFALTQRALLRDSARALRDVITGRTAQRDRSAAVRPGAGRAWPPGCCLHRPDARPPRQSGDTRYGESLRCRDHRAADPGSARACAYPREGCAADCGESRYASQCHDGNRPRQHRASGA